MPRYTRAVQKQKRKLRHKRAAKAASEFQVRERDRLALTPFELAEYQLVRPRKIPRILTLGQTTADRSEHIIALLRANANGELHPLQIRAETRRDSREHKWEHRLGVAESRMHTVFVPRPVFSDEPGFVEKVSVLSGTDFFVYHHREHRCWYIAEQTWPDIYHPKHNDSDGKPERIRVDTDWHWAQTETVFGEETPIRFHSERVAKRALKRYHAAGYTNAKHRNDRVARKLDRFRAVNDGTRSAEDLYNDATERRMAHQ